MDAPGPLTPRYRGPVTSIPSGRAPDTWVGGYRLLTKIGEGGMGVVHLAVGEDGRRVALKVLRPHVVGDDEARTRLAREVASLRRVHSRHVAEVLDADPWGDLPFIVTRYVPGHALLEAVRREGPLGPRDLEHAGRGLIEAVRDVHAAGVLHRDLKPTNVVMEGRAPILIDFGLARLAEDPRLTATGWMLGTPGYLAPEVIFGDEATTATDVHGWAATLAYAATGASPYGGGHTVAILDRTRRGEVDLTRVPASLRGLLAACLALEARDRPTTGEVLVALDGLAAADLPTSTLGTAPRPFAAPVADPTLPWPHVRPEDPATEVLAAVPDGPSTSVLRAVPPVSSTPDAPPPPGSIAPSPLPRSPSPGAPLRRGSALLLLAVLVALLFRSGPYLTLAGAAVAALAVRGLHRGQEAHGRRRATRGPRWFDAPLSVLAYPWHTVRAAAGSVFLVLTAGLGSALVAAALVLGGVRTADALLGGGAVLALGLWRGPGSDRVRPPVGGWVTAAVRPTGSGWALVAALALLVGVLWWVAPGTSWAPAASAPWRDLRALFASWPL